MLLVTMALSVTFVGHSYSHGSGTHGQPATEAQIIERAAKGLDALVKKGKVDASWSETAFTTTQMEHKKYGTLWVVTYSNPKIEENKENTLYLFLTLGGKYLGANYIIPWEH